MAASGRVAGRLGGAAEFGGKGGEVVSLFVIGRWLMAWNLLFTSDIGLMSLVVIVGVLVIGAVMGKMYSNKIDEESRKLGK
jgi:hypothetical protein